ncbi:MAG: MATE family efflux transporter [Sphingomonadales bacterium]|nr:MATE family efflux transporter [Sphingomonadales bacterium]PIX66650.1 MAG: MATE family efflux transporter [Sphingomonadales bacterium CG_4_10_14_3_um_filter_58_15]NCO49786.1 MATE family efflux transporter [Sphingomonadales bacterium]NCP01644.1 MATE family efflux transporter [Sphingomonadales bacterium]NCP27572.1 MATE family efflux transporter [Sphingomonadales bacterium]
MSESAKLTTGSISGHLVAQTAPMLFGIAAIMSIGIIDAYFIGQLGSKQLAAVSFIFPITIALSSLGVGVIAGISSVVSRALGSDDPGRAQQLGNLGMVLAASFGLIVALALYLLKGPLFQLMQADDDLLPLIDAYMTPYALGFPLLLTNMGGNGVLRGQGAAKRASAILLAFAGANWILDPILITGIGSFEGFGIAGAAYATIAGWAVGTLLAIIFVQSSDIKINPTCLTSAHWGGGIWSLIKVGGPAALSNAINPIGLSILTAFLARYGQDEVAGFGAAGRLQSFAVVPMLGLSSSIGAIVGQNWGAGKTGRARKAVFYAIGFSLVYGLMIAALLVFARDWFGGFFSEDAEVLDALSRYLLIAAWGFAGFGVLVVVNGAFNAIDRAPVALGQSAGRVFLVMIPFAWLAGGALGSNAVYSAELAANIVGGVVAAALAWYVMRR